MLPHVKVQRQKKSTMIDKCYESDILQHMYNIIQIIEVILFPVDKNYQLKIHEFESVYGIKSHSIAKRSCE